MPLQLIGYWRNEQHPEYPDPNELVDETWAEDDDDRHILAMYFGSGTYLRGFMGLSPCRICGEHNGSGEFTDGVLVWPEGLAHYVREHAVRLPRSIVTYVLQAVDRLEDPAISTDWWVAGAKGDVPAD